jgi:CRISPR system Cascade subunit CasE
MYMIDLPLDSAKLMRFAHTQGIPLGPDEDFGYAVHAWLAAAFGDLAPRPFRLFERRDGLHLLGYANHEIDLLRETAQSFAEPLAMEVCQWSHTAGKSMPENWTEGSRIGFEVRVCPVIRGERERDVFLSALERSKENKSTPPIRMDIYLGWLIQRMKAATKPGGDFVDIKGKVHSPVVELLPGRVSLAGFRRVRVLRRSRNDNKGKSVKDGIERPDAIFSGDMVIRKPEKFAILLERGIGRHKAFGFGMLLLRPPGQ